MSYADRAKNHQITTIMIHRDDDAAIIAWLNQQKNNTEAIKRAIYFYLQHGQSQPASASPSPLDKEALRGVIAEALADIRQIIQTALETYASTSPLPLGEGPGVRANKEEAEVNSLLANLIVSLDL